MDLVRNIHERSTKKGVTYDVRLSVPGHGRQFKGGFATRAEAAKWRDKIEAASNAQAMLRQERLKLPMLIELWMEATGKDKQGSTRTTQRSTLNVHIKPYLDVPVDHITAFLLEDYFDDLPDRPRIKGTGYSTAKHVSDMVRASLRWAARPDIKIIEVNPLRDVPIRLPAKGKARRAVAIEHFTAIIANAKDLQRKLLWTVLGYTGLRRGEATALRWEDIDWVTEMLSVRRIATPESKGHKVEEGRVKMKQIRDVPMAEEVVDALRTAWVGAGRPKTGYIFASTRKAAPIGFTAVQRWWVAACAELGLEDGYYTVHGLRHMFTTLLLDNGEDLKTVSEILGHSSTKTTQDVYQHIGESHKKKSIKKLGKIMKGNG